MGICPAQSFPNITPDKWQALIEKGAQYQFPLGGDSGQSTEKEFTFCWQYDATSSILTIQCLDHPFLTPCSVINKKIQALIVGLCRPTNPALVPVESSQAARR
jgi:hypothetical protein